MTDRYALRFASGGREGETVPLAEPRTTVGRRPGNTLLVDDSSVSGQHAEFVIEGQSVTLRDLGSTNGTRVGGQKITLRQLASGDEIAFGKVEAIFFEAGLEAPVTPDEGALEISAEVLARSGERSKAGLLVGLALLAGVGGAAAFFFLGGSAGIGRRVTAPPKVAGHLIAGGDFEGDQLSSNWTIVALGGADFAQSGSARFTGRDGLRSSLEPGERARLESDSVTVTPGRILQLAASLRVQDGGAGRVGVEFLPIASNSEEQPGGLMAWSETVTLASGHRPVELEAPVPPGVRSARVVVEGAASATEGGTVDVDDLSLVAQRAGATPTAKVGEFTLWLMGQPASTATLFKISKPLFIGLHGVAEDPAHPAGLSQSSESGGLALNFSGATGGLSLRICPEALRQGLASLGVGGLVDHALQFERQSATSLILARGKDLCALHFSAPVEISGRPEGQGVRVEIRGAAATRVLLQLDFNANRAEAGNLAHSARKAEKDGRLGDCLAAWERLLLEQPFDVQLMAEAREVRGRLVQTGLAELATVAEAFERAKFFRLLDLFRQCRDQAGAVAQRYAGSEVEAQADALSAEVEAALQGLESDLDRDEVARLQSILTVLEATESAPPAGEVRAILKTEIGVGN